MVAWLFLSSKVFSSPWTKQEVFRCNYHLHWQMQKSGAIDSNGLGMSFELRRNTRAIAWTFAGFSAMGFKLQRTWKIHSRRSLPTKILVTFPSHIARHLSKTSKITPFAMYHGNTLPEDYGIYWSKMASESEGKSHFRYTVLPQKKMCHPSLSLKSRHNWEAENKSSLVEAFSLNAVYVKNAEAKFFWKEEWQIEIKICVTHS